MTNGPVIATEEHFVTGEVLDAWGAVEPAWRDLSLTPSREGQTAQRLAELGPRRLEAMDAVGVETQVLSLGPPGLQNLPASQAVALQTAVNDRVASVVGDRPDRFQAFAAVATPAPAQAARELERAVRELGLAGAMLYGRTRERNLDHPDFWPIFEVAADLRAPLYLHPQSPPPAVRAAYYEGYDPRLDAGLATFGMGWHYEAGVQFVRMVLSGVFDRFPELQVVLGHWGEVALFYLDRVDELAAVADIARAPSEYARSNLFVTAGGILSLRYLRWSIEVLGVERVLFGADYPFAVHAAGDATRFLEQSGLSDGDQALVAHGNWMTLREGIRR